MFKNSVKVHQIVKNYKHLTEILEPTGYIAKRNALLLKVDLLERLLNRLTRYFNAGDGRKSGLLCIDACINTVTFFCFIHCETYLTRGGKSHIKSQTRLDVLIFFKNKFCIKVYIRNCHWIHWEILVLYE